MPPVLAANFEKRFAGGPVIRTGFEHPLDGFSVTALLGPSGCGKTTILRAIAGLTSPDAGRIAFGDETWFDHMQRIRLSPQARGIGFLFQEYALFPHLDVTGNIAFGLRGLPAAERSGRVAELIELLRLRGLEHRRIDTLSGGQQQRVALARTVAPRPRLLLLDEPLSALDAATRTELRAELRTMLAELAIPTLLVTHDADEVRALASHVVLIGAGQSGLPRPVH